MDLIRTYQIVTNMSCNLDCSYCYEKKYPRNNKVEDVVDFLHACFDRDKDIKDITVIIDFIGGEPFMQPKLVYAACETVEQICKERGITSYVFSFSTNGTLFDRPRNQEIIERWKDRISVGVSIDGLKEMHDKYRIFTTSREGSYDKAVAGFKYLKSMGIRELGVKATFTSETFKHYAASMKSIIDVTGGGYISGNITYEDILPRSSAFEVANQIIEVIKYWVDGGYHKEPANDLAHIIPQGLDFDAIWSPENRERILNDDLYRNDPDRVRPFCGTISSMTCLGFDRNIYGCNRFMSTVTTRDPIAKLVGREIVIDETNPLADEVANQVNDYPESCQGCPTKHICASCAAASYENGDGNSEARKAYHAERRQCGWTTAKQLVGQWLHREYGSWSLDFMRDPTLCNCPQCRGKRLKQGTQTNEASADNQFYEA